MEKASKIFSLINLIFKTICLKWFGFVEWLNDTMKYIQKKLFSALQKTTVKKHERVTQKEINW